MQCKELNKKGKQCQNKAIDATGYCRWHHSQINKKPSDGIAFEQQVLKILRLLGYKAERNVFINGCQIDLYGVISTGVITLRLMVECKNYGKNKLVGIKDINKFSGVLAVARNNGAVDKGLFVSTYGYTPAAKVNAKAAGIELTTYEKLSTQLVNFEDYIEKIINEFKESPISTYYIDLCGTELEDYDGADESFFNRPIDKYINSRLFEENCNKLALLGNFGTGKTLFCKKYAFDLATQYNENKTGRIPIIINLSEYDSKIHIQQLIVNTLQFRYNINITLKLCQELQRLGKFLLLLDGFDEMAYRVDPDIIRENLREINKISEITENKLIVTCRTHFFRDRVQAEVLADFDIIYIPEWGEKELREYLKKRFDKNWKKQFNKIRGTHNLPELAQTPLFLDMIVESLPKLGDEVRRVELYQVYTNKWIKEQSKRRGARLTAEQRKQFVEELALKLYSEDIISCHHKEFIQIIRKKFEIDDAAQMDYLKSDVQTCTFLTRDADGYYAFRHKSFMEFFIASRLAEEIRKEKYKTIAIKVLPLEIRGFLVDFLSIDPPADNLKELLKSIDDSILRDNILSLISRLKINISDTQLFKEPEKETEAKIINNFLQGNSESFDFLYSKYQKAVSNYVNKHVYQKDLVEDIVIDTFMKAWTYRERLDRFNNLLPYLFKIARNLCIDAYRRDQRVRRVSIDIEEEYHIDFLAMDAEMIDPGPEIPLIEREEELKKSEYLSKAFLSLSEIEKRVITGLFHSGKSYSDLELELNIERKKIANIRYRALNKIKHIIKEKSYNDNKYLR